MNKKIINVFILTLSVLFLIYGIALKVFDKLDYPDFFRIMALAYTFFVYSVLRIKNALNGEIFLEAFKIIIVIYAFYTVFLFFGNYKIFCNTSYDFEISGVLSNTEYFLMIFIPLVSIITKYHK